MTSYRDWQIKEYQAIDSTMTEAHLLLEKTEFASKTVLIAETQTKGRGRESRSWISLKGNFHASLMIRPDISENDWPLLSFVSALSVGRTLQKYIGSNNILNYKWPNDVLLNSKKIAGILLEAEKSSLNNQNWLIIGIGVNLIAAPQETSYPASHMQAETGHALQPLQLLRELLANFDIVERILKAQGFEPICKEWLASASHVGKDIRVNIKTSHGSQEILGRFLDLDNLGRLLIETPEGVRHALTAGDVYF